MKKSTFYFFSLFVLLSTGSVQAHAQVSNDLSVTPVVIDEKAKPRDIIKATITLKNTSNHKLDLYPGVNNINSEEGKQSFSVAGSAEALSNSLANWIELSRGIVELSPGEQKTVSFIIRLNFNAIPGTYHAQISFFEGGTRAEAESRPPLSVVTVNVEVQADVKELLQLNKFTTGNIFFSGDDILFNYKLQNIGNQELQPKGQIHVYDRKGVEVATIGVNRDGKNISPDQVTQLASVWSAADGFGRYKAMLDVAYGSSQTASVQDTVFFWIVPWKQMLILFTISLITMVILALYFHRWLERRHLYKFAHAGLLNEHTLKKIHTEDIEAPLFPIETQSQTEEVIKPKQSLKEVLQKKESSTAHGSSINMKQLRAHTEAIKTHTHHVSQETHAHKAEVRGHVISLKKHK